MSVYGDGSDGVLHVTSGTYNLNLNQKYQFSSVTIDAGATLSTSSTTGAVLYILCSGTFTLNGTIDVSNRVTYGNNSWSVTIDGTTYTSPGVANGGSGGNFISSQVATQTDGFGGGGQGGFYLSSLKGGLGGNGSSTFGAPGGRRSSDHTGTSYDIEEGGYNASGSAGGSGSSYSYYSGGAVYRQIVVSGAGGSDYGANGENGITTTMTYVSGTGGGTYLTMAMPGGGAGGRAGRSGVHIVIKARALVLNGAIVSSGSAGGSGGNSGRVLQNGGLTSDFRGCGGGGGGGGNAGDIQLVYQDSVSDSSAKTMSGGAGGAVGRSVGGSQATPNATAGTSGMAGSASTTRIIELSAGFSASSTSGTAPLAVTFTDTTLGAPTSWSWDFGDGGTSTSQNPSHTYTTPGLYTVTLTASNSTMSDSAGQNIQVLAEVAPNGVAPTSSVGSPTITQRDPPPPPAADWSALGKEDKKEYLYKVYDRSGSFFAVWSDEVVDPPQFTQPINSPGTTMTVKLARSANTTREVRSSIIDPQGNFLVDPDGNNVVGVYQTSNTVGQDTDVDVGNFVDVFVQYGGFDNIVDPDGNFLVDPDGNSLVGPYGAPLGTRIFSGYILDYTSRYGEESNVIVTLASHGAETSQELIRSGSTTTVTYTTTELATIVKSILDTNPGKLSYDADSIDTTGVARTLTFRLNTKLEGIKSVYNQTPDGWYWYGDVANNLLYLKPSGTTPDHVFYLGKHIKSIEMKRSIESLVNAVWFVGGQTTLGDPATTQFKYYEDGTSRTTWGRKGIERISDARYTVAASMQGRAQKLISRYKDPIFTTPLTITSGKYDIETIKLGQMVGFANFGNFIDDLLLQIVNLSYTPTAVTIELGELQDRQVDIVADTADDLANAQYETIPNAPT